ncbi:hypothetical protein [Streptomyces pristinaespiralis]|uniref:hypothetical protein n=1 Tax=Streptomyces pristinaespiralis TaxID=38300 RepID=UPI0033F961E8
MEKRQRLYEYFRLSSARKLMAPFHDRLPVEVDRWEPALAPMIRGMRYSADGGGANLYEVSAELRTAADLFASALSEGTPVPKNMPTADPVERTPHVLREIAAHVEEWNSLPKGEAAMTTRELALRFPRLIPKLSIYFGQDGSAISDEMSGSAIEEGIAMWIDQIHPRCPWELPGTAAECYEALALFQNEDALDRFFAQEHGGGSGAVDFEELLPLLAQSCIDHMKAHHPPVWEKR